jgi:hypothetical protein
MERPAPPERIAVFERRLFPGRESMIDCAFFLGSSAGTFDACLWELIAIEIG